MKRRTIILLILTFLTISTNGQNVEDLENELRYSYNSEFTDKINLARKLIAIDPLNRKGIDYIINYYETMKIDSIGTFLESLSKKNEDNAEVNLIRSEYVQYENTENYLQKKLEYLLKAEKLDSANLEAISSIAEIYYRDFIFPYTKPEPYEALGDKVMDSLFNLQYQEDLKKERKSNFSNSSHNALKYLNRIWLLYPEEQSTIYFAIKQIETFLEIKNDNRNLSHNNLSFFPYGHYMNLEENWSSDKSINYLFSAQMANSKSNWLSKQLKSLGEKSILNNFEDKIEIFRFTWLRSFNNPITVRLHEDNGDYFVHFAIGKGAGGYEPEGIKKIGKRKISKKALSEFKKEFEKLNYNSLPNDYYVLMTDGADWNLEYKYGKQFYSKNTNSPSLQFQKVCMLLIDMANIKIDKEDIY